VSVAARCLVAGGGNSQGLNLLISQGSIHINDVKLHAASPKESQPYISLAASSGGSAPSRSMTYFRYAVRSALRFAAICTLGTPCLRADPVPSPQAATGTFEYAKTHAVHAPSSGYPAVAGLRRWTGAGLFELYLRPDGTVSNVHVLQSKGHAVLDEEGISTFRKWRFHPGQFHTIRIPLSFTINGRL
jgi:TonB family protein